MDWKKESGMFNQMANYYDKYRPSYPQEIIDIFISKANLSSGSNLLEIGAGSGKATELFTGRNFNMLCIEPGAGLIKIGNAKFEAENFTFHQARFEECKLSAESFDVVFAAQAFHWIPQPQGFEKCAYILKKRGYLAPFWNMYITYDNELDNELLAISAKYGGFADFLSIENCENRINSIASEIENSGLFSKPEIVRSLWKQTYTADEYYGFVLTGNLFVQKSSEEKQEAYEDLKQLAEKYGGKIERPYLCVLYLAQKL